ncbi:hypothetical protein KXD40_000515 [Peronospora effusa]|nr:hypothetical protein KXD40_000515 [Peronospora effusa]
MAVVSQSLATVHVSTQAGTLQLIPKLFGMLRTILRFTNDGVLPLFSTLQDDSANTQRLELEIVADESVLHPLVDLKDEDIWKRRARHSKLAKYSKVLQASKGKSIHRSFCNFYAKVQCIHAVP